MAQRDDPVAEPMIARDATYHRAPEALRTRIRASLAAQTRSERAPRFWRTFGFAASFAAAAMLGWLVGLYYAKPGADERIVGDVVAAHVRSLLAENHLNDVASSDQHTVKPWFAGKLDYAPPVRDLSNAGFVLIGGRLDYVGGRAVAALTYRYRQHVVNLFVWPATGESPPAETANQGYSVLAWRRGGMQYWAVADVGPGQLRAMAD